MNKSNIKYSIIFEYQDASDINYLKDLEINFINIKKLTLNQNIYIYSFDSTFSFCKDMNISFCILQ